MTEVKQGGASGALPNLPMTLVAGRTSTWIFLLTSLALAAGCGLMARDGDMTGYYGCAFFLFCSLVFFGLLHPRASYLALTESGFLYCYDFRKLRFSWSQVAEFGVAKSGLSRRVGWNFHPKTSGASHGFEGELPDGYRMDAEELAELMEQLRVRHAPNS